MKAILLDGSQANDSTGERVRGALEAELKIRGWEVELILLCEKKIGACAGDFFCFVRSPGVCNVDDDNRDIAEAHDLHPPRVLFECLQVLASDGFHTFDEAIKCSHLSWPRGAA